MYNFYWKLLQLVQFYLAADTPGNVHSPLVFKMLSYILDTTRIYYDFAKIEILRELALTNEESIEFVDYGAGSSVTGKKRRSLRSIIQSSVSTPRQCQTLYRLCDFLKPAICLELGSSVGISTAYLAKANSKGQVFSIEGDPTLSALARFHLQKLNIQNARILTGPFSNTIPLLLNEVDSINLIFMDGNHAYAPTLKYYDWIKAKLLPTSVLILDDIYWSEDMLKAWNKIISLPEVTYSINLFEFGIILFDPVFKQKKHLRVVDRKFKPWK